MRFLVMSWADERDPKTLGFVSSSWRRARERKPCPLDLSNSPPSAITRMQVRPSDPSGPKMPSHGQNSTQSTRWRRPGWDGIVRGARLAGAQFARGLPPQRATDRTTDAIVLDPFCFGIGLTKPYAPPDHDRDLGLHTLARPERRAAGSAKQRRQRRPLALDRTSISRTL